MPDLLSELASVHAYDKAVVSDNENALTLRALVKHCNALAEQLTQLNVKTLALLGDNSLDWIITDIACQLASIVFVPLPTFFSVDQQRHVLSSIAVDAVLIDPKCTFALPATVQCNITPLASHYALVRHSLTAQALALPEHTQKITFTSGSTGTPKGVCLSAHQQLLQAHALSAAVNLYGPRHLCLLPLSTLLENIAGVYTPLLSGGEVITPSLSEIGFTGSSAIDPQAFCRVINRYSPNTMILTPQLLLLLVTAATQGWQPPESLAFIAVGGGKVPAHLLEQSRTLGLPVYEGYGLSECASVVSLSTASHQKSRRCGKPLPHLAVKIEQGEIVVSGNAMLGYAGDPTSWNPPRIHTGDLGSIDKDGYLSILGRKKNVLISSFGRNINPEWIESEILANGKLSQCIVFGDNKPYCVALLTPRDTSETDESIQQIIEATNQRLPDYAQIKQWHRLVEPFSTANQLLTENARPKRDGIAKAYNTIIESLYAPKQQTPIQ